MSRWERNREEKNHIHGQQREHRANKSSAGGGFASIGLHKLCSGRGGNIE